MKRTIFLIVIICVILYFQYPYINTINNSFEILQFNNPNKSILENMLSEKKISIFTNIPIECDYNGIYPEYFTKDFVLNLQNNKEYKKILNENLEYYKIPLCIKSFAKINYFDQNSNIILQNNYRFFIVNLNNTIKISLFSPNQKENLYFNKNNISNIDFHNADYDKYPNLNNVKYIEILLHKNQMISIPYKWMYIINKHSDDNSVLLTYTNESLFSKLLKR